MMKQRIYIDTSVIGGYHDKEFESDTLRLFERIQNNEFAIYLSEISRLELFPAPKTVQDVLTLIPAESLIILDFTEEAKQLAECYTESWWVCESKAA
jgi:predicted nucleic acid-binding protein